MNLFKENDPVKTKELKYLGFTKVGHLDPEALKELKRETSDLLKQLKKEDAGNELLNLINAEFATKTASNQMVGKYFTPFLKTVINTEVADIHPVSHIIKPFGLKSAIWHQDSSIVDERTDFSLNAWTPLVNSHRLNGCIWVFPGSHYNTNHARQFGYNPVEKGLLRTLRPYMVPIFVDAGEVLLFHRNIIHGSSRNWLPMNRVAIESVIVPKNVQFYNYHREESVSKDKILGFQVEMEHFLREQPKDDFYNGRYPHVKIDDPGFEGIEKNLINDIPVFLKHAKKFYDAVI